MNHYTVEMQSGHDYIVYADGPESAMREAERMAQVVHGVSDRAVHVH